MSDRTKYSSTEEGGEPFHHHTGISMIIDAIMMTAYSVWLSTSGFFIFDENSAPHWRILIALALFGLTWIIISLSTAPLGFTLSIGHFIKGVGSVISIFPIRRRHRLPLIPDTAPTSSLEALQLDWRQTRQDLGRAFKEMENS
ncbi:MAG TPA: hypothetical protein VGO67_18855 [Verrucomicrobiae bacterium]|jgi:hypothetical protein